MKQYIRLKTVYLVRVIRVRRYTFKKRLANDLLKIKKGLAQESTETKEMLQIYRRYTQKQASKEEMRIANKQFLDLLKGMGLGIFAILPFAPITIPLVVALGKKLGINVLPSAFCSNKESKKNKK